MKSLAQRRQSAPSLVLSKALKSRSTTKESCFSPVSPETCPLVQTFVCPSREFIMHSHVQLKTGLQTQDRHLFLFTDIMIIAKSKSPSQYKLKHHVRVSEMWTASCMEEVCEGSTYPERSFVIGWPITNCVATFSTPEEKEKWLALLQRHIKDEKESDHPKTILLKIITKDIGICAYSKTLAVTNDDTVSDVIKMAVQQFGIEGSDTDYQLWVTSGKDDAPYPLIGHEYPFGIKMSHIRDALPQIQGTKDSSCPLTIEGPFQMEQLPREMQCQFILKPSRLALCHQLADSSQKPFKRKRSIINWTFWRGSNTQLDTIPLSPTSSAPGKLFGLSLSVICENDNLPRPVMDMLSVLYQEGPFTRGIFRRSANAKACKEMKERLNSGCEVNFACESIFVTASVFKDFLRNIPGSIFLSKLYDKWTSVMDQGNQQEKIKTIKKLLEKLPHVNIILLHYLFGVLHCIEKHSETNQMTAFNLAVCIAPSLLWLPSPSSAEAEGEFTGKVSMLVQFLIENCCIVFGEDILLLFANLSTKDYNGEDHSDVCSFKHIDSSYDSLENELNDDVDSPLQELTNKLSCGNRSRDSVLTLSDCDLDHPDGEDAHTEHILESHPARMSTVLHHKSASHEHSENESVCSNTSGYSSATVSDALKDVRRHRRCSEPAIGILVSRFSQLNESPHENTACNTSCDVLICQSEEDYLKQHRYLQVEGQKLINRSLTLGIDVNKSIGKKQTTEEKNISSRLLAPPALRLNLCPQTSCSSLSSPGTSPSGSSLSSLDSAFSQFSDYSVLSPNEVPSPLNCNLQSYKKQVDLTPDFLSSSSFSGFSFDEDVKQSYDGSLVTGNGVDWPCRKSPVRIHPNTRLKSSTSNGKNWSTKTKDNILTKGEKNKSVVNNVTTEELQSNTTYRSELLLLQEQIIVPNRYYETKHCSTVKQPKDCKKDAPLSCTSFLCEDINRTTRHVVKSKDVDKNANGENEIECSSFILPSPVSINIEISAHNQENTLIPQTIFFSQDLASIRQTDRKKSTKSFNVEEPQLLNSSRKCSSDHSVYSHAVENSSVKEEATKTTIGRDISIRVASFKKNKILPSNVDTGVKIANCDLDKNFCVSPKLTTTTEDFFFQPDIHKHLKNSPECDNTVIRSSRDWQTKRCSDPTFEELDQRFFAEESYV
ncbi:rho GTPase-activating protein 20 [Rhinophrynus dorsalis]